MKKKLLEYNWELTKDLKDKSFIPEELSNLVNKNRHRSDGEAAEFWIDVDEITIKNIDLEPELLFYCMNNFEGWNQLRSINLVNTIIRNDILCYVLTMLVHLSPNLEVLNFEGIFLFKSFEKEIAELLVATQLQELIIKNCSLDSKAFGVICLSIVDGKSLNSLDVSYNMIGKKIFELDHFGAGYVAHLIKYFSPLKKINFEKNLWQDQIDENEESNVIKRAIKYSQRASTINIVI